MMYRWHYLPTLIHKGTITGEPKLKMQYKTFFRDITIKQHVALRNWPHKELKSPGTMGHSLPAISKLLELVTSGEIFFEMVDEEELQEMIEAEDEKIASGEVVVTARKIRKDIGTSQQGTNKRQLEDSDTSGSDSNGPPAKKARTLIAGPAAKKARKKATNRSASLVVDSDSE